MSKTISISIPEPCHEKWDDMTPNEKGRFCNACAKTVVDFSVMTDTQVLHYLIDRQDEKICGRMLKEQLDTPISIDPPVKRKIKWYWNAAAAIALLFARPGAAKAQGTIRTETSPVKPADNSIRGKIAVRPAQQVLTGKIVDKDGNPVPFASVMISNKKTGVSADVNGDFRIQAGAGTWLQIAAAGFEPFSYLTTAERNCRIVLKVLERQALKGEIVIVAGGLSWKPAEASPPQSQQALFVIKDDHTGKAVPGALIQIINRTSGSRLSVQAKSGGKYKMKPFLRRQEYFVRVTAEGYEANEFIISADNDADRDLLQEVRLRKTAVVNTSAQVVCMKQVRAEDLVALKDAICLSKTEPPLQEGPKPVLIQAAGNDNDPTGQHAVSIYPNPVSRGNAVHIAWVVKQKGPHIILVNDVAGLLVSQKQETAMPGKIQSSVFIDEKWTSGMYFVRILNPEGKQVYESSFIVQ